MKLRPQSIWLVASATVCYFLVVSLVAGWVLLPTADREDRTAMTLQLQRLRSRLDGQMKLMQTAALDYGARAETVRFVQEAHDARPAQGSLVPEQLRRVALDVVIVWDASGRLRLARGKTNASHSPPELSAGVIGTVAEMVSWTRVMEGPPMQGILGTPEGGLLFGAAAINDDKPDTAPLGVMISGRFLSPQVMEAAAIGRKLHRRIAE